MLSNNSNPRLIKVLSEAPEQNRIKLPALSERTIRQATPLAASAPSLYVGIGASAGGLAVLQAFFDRMVEDCGAAFIVVLHLSPDFDSQMDELLARHTSMNVQFASNGMDVMANSVYLIPPNSNLRINGGRLYIERQIRNSMLNLPIDIFFHSLAEDARHRSVGVILSGSGSDGSRGIKHIKEAGGLVLVQDCDSAQFDGMPYVAALTGTADLILPPVELAEHLSMFLSSSMVRTTAMLSLPRIDPDDPVLSELFLFLISQSSIDFSRYESRSVRQRIGRRMDIHQSTLLSEYLQVLQQSSNEQNILVRDLLIPISTFFDNSLFWEYLSSEVLQPLIRTADSQQGLRLWVIGCATGEEAYSLAMLTDEAMQLCERLVPIKIFATDIDKSSLEAALTGEYGKEITPDVTEERLHRYFEQVEDNYTVRRDIRGSVLFATHDLVNDAPYPSVDLILCRKVLQYFEKRSQADALSAIQRSLKNNASLFLSASDPVTGQSNLFKSVNEALQHYTRIPDPGVAIPRTPAADPIFEHLNRQLPLAVEARQPGNMICIELVKNRLIDQHIASSIILDSNEHIVQLFGRASDYLTHSLSCGPTKNIHNLISLELKNALKSALRSAKTSSETICRTNLPCRLGHRSVHVTIAVRCYKAKYWEDSFYSVVILDENAMRSSAEFTQSFPPSKQARQHVSVLENQLAIDEDPLQLINEALEGSSAQYRACGEALTIANDELRRVNNQLQSVNKQLSTINNIHEEKIDELIRTADDTEHVLNSISIGLIYLNNELLIRNYTPESTKYFHLTPDDIGSSLPDVAHGLIYDRLSHDIATTHKTHHSRNCTVATRSGDWVKVDILPYHSKHPEPSLHSAVAVKVTPIEFRPDDNAAVHHLGVAGRPPSHQQSLPVIPRISLLIVDDNKLDRVRIARFLNKIESINIDIFEAHNVSSALRSLKKNNISVCLIDYRLTRATAHDLAKSISEFNDTLPIILMSGSPRDQLAEKVSGPLLEYYLNKEDISPLLLELSIRHAIREGLELTPQLLSSETSEV